MNTRGCFIIVRWGVGEGTKVNSQRKGLLEGSSLLRPGRGLPDAHLGLGIFCLPLSPPFALHCGSATSEQPQPWPRAQQGHPAVRRFCLQQTARPTKSRSQDWNLAEQAPTSDMQTAAPPCARKVVLGSAPGEAKKLLVL